MNWEFWKQRRVLITGHTGFKGSWLSLWLQSHGVPLVGYALQPPTQPSLFDLAHVGDGMVSIIGDIRDPNQLQAAFDQHQPEIVLHLAAQPIVRLAYAEPVETFQTNVMGTVNLLEAARKTDSVRAVVNVTTDKCYLNREWFWGYREDEPLGGHDPYSSSKACSELVSAAYRTSFFQPQDRVRLATARAGNVIGGGDWAQDRLVPDIINALMAHRPPEIRAPNAIRPWQHVLDPLHGYLLLAERLWTEPDLAEAWNFGPYETSAQTVGYITHYLSRSWGFDRPFEQSHGQHPHEANYLKLDSSKAHARLGWRPRFDLHTTLDLIIAWYQGLQKGLDPRALTLHDIETFESIQESLT